MLGGHGNFLTPGLEVEDETASKLVYSSRLPSTPPSISMLIFSVSRVSRLENGRVFRQCIPHILDTFSTGRPERDQHDGGWTSDGLGTLEEGLRQAPWRSGDENELLVVLRPFRIGSLRIEFLDEVFWTPE